MNTIAAVTPKIVTDAKATGNPNEITAEESKISEMGEEKKNDFDLPKTDKMLTDYEIEGQLLEEEFQQIKRLVEKKMASELKLNGGVLNDCGPQNPLYGPFLSEFHCLTPKAVKAVQQMPSTKDNNKVGDSHSVKIMNKDATVVVGKGIKNPNIHFCGVCKLPIRIYGRMIPCKHAFCKDCALKNPSSCPKCSDKVNQIDTHALGALFMCDFKGSQYGYDGCRRTYVSRRDLDAHFDHRHKAKPGANGNGQSQPLPPGVDPLPIPVVNTIEGPRVNDIGNGNTMATGNHMGNGNVIWNNNSAGNGNGSWNYGHGSIPIPDTRAPPFLPMPAPFPFVPSTMPMPMPQQFPATPVLCPFYHYANSYGQGQGHGFVYPVTSTGTGEQNRLQVPGHEHGNQPKPHPSHPYWQ